jgi:hypothetical protein
LELALGAVTPQGFGLIGFVFCLLTPTPPLAHMLLLLPLPLHFSNNGITNLVIFVALAYHL